LLIGEALDFVFDLRILALRLRENGSELCPLFFQLLQLVFQLLLIASLAIAKILRRLSIVGFFCLNSLIRGKSREILPRLALSWLARDSRNN